MRIKKIITLILTISMIFSTSLFTAYGATASGTTLELEKYTGDVKITNTLGVEMKISGVSKLFSGYTITTSEGYAWVSIDADQVVKLDWNTQVTLKKNGTKTELLVDSGEILFMVNKPLEATASFTIRTSTMSTGVRGTIGHVSVKYANDTDNNRMKTVSTLSMLEGSTLMSTISENDVTADGVTSLTTKLVSASQEAVATASSQIGGAVETEVNTISVGDTIRDNGFVAVELKDNEEFQNRLSEEITEEEMEDIISNADSSQESDEKAYQEEAASASDDVDNALSDLQDDDETTTDSTLDTPEESSSSSGGGGGGGSSSSSSSSTSYDCVVTYYYFEGAVSIENASVYATQTILADETISMPALQPSQYGDWYDDDLLEAFDGFDSVIIGEKTLSLYWIASDSDTSSNGE